MRGRLQGRLRLLMWVAALTSITACAPDTTAPVGGSRAGRSTSVQAIDAILEVPTFDDTLADVANVAPGFGGVFVDVDGALVVAVTATADRSKVLSALETIASGALLRNGENGDAYPNVRYQQVDYDVRDLIRWRSALRAAWVPGITLVDVDERANRLRLGVRDQEVRVALERRLAELDVPSGAVVIQLSASAVQRTSLGDRFRPVPGGVREYYVYDAVGSSAACTVMVNAQTDLGLGFVTPGHCSYQQGGSPDMTAHYQNSATISNLVGYEVADSPLHACVENSDGGCRYADASFVAYDSAAFAELGYLARTVSPNSIYSRTIDSNHPRFAVEEPSTPGGSVTVGTTVYKIGASSGWTSGTITGTCVDVAVRGYDFSLGREVTWMYKCQGESNLRMDDGDSGAPVFTWDGTSSTVVIRGIGVVSNAAEGVMQYSRWATIVLELSVTTGSLVLSN